MKRNLIWVTVFGLTACARGGVQPTVTVAPQANSRPAAATPEGVRAGQEGQRTPGLERPAADSTPAGQATVASGQAAAAQAPTPPGRVGPASPFVVDTVTEEAFLDSLRSLAADTSQRPGAVVSVEAVRNEAATLFGPNANSPTWDLDVLTYASHERVQYWIDYFTTRSRWHFARYLERQGRYDSMIRTRLAAAGLPQDLLYLAMIESGFAHSIRSRAGAVGMWQFIPGTARRYGLSVDAWVDDRRDPYLATDAAIRLLAELNSRFGSFWLAAAAYNGGPGRVIRGLRRYDVSDLSADQQYFALSEERAFRQETRDYVPKLIAAALIGKEPDRYGFRNIRRWEPLVYDSVTVGFAVGLDVLARLAGARREVIEDMNARFHRGVTPPDRTVWVRVPPGAADSVSARLAVLPAADRVTVLFHTVERGETLSRIARRYGVSLVDLRSANPGLGRVLPRGRRLVIPALLARLNAVARAGADERRARTARRTTASARATAPAGPRTSAASGTVRRVHIVRSGETLWQISRDFNVPLSRLLEANRLTRRSTIRPGQAVRIPI